MRQRHLLQFVLAACFALGGCECGPKTYPRLDEARGIHGVVAHDQCSFWDSSPA